MAINDILERIQNSWREGEPVPELEKTGDTKDGADGKDKDKKSDAAIKDPKQVEPEPSKDEEPEHWKIARLDGWMPEEEWKEAGKDLEEWKPAKAFLKDGEFRSELRKLKRAMKRKDKQLDNLYKEREMVVEKAYERARADLIKEREAAAEADDLKGVVAASDRLAELDKEQVDNAAKVEQKEYEISDDEKGMLHQWGQDNQWYIDNPELQSYVHNIAAQYMDNNEDAMLIEAFEFAGKQARASFPQQTRGKQVKSAVGDTPPARRGGKTPEGRVPQPHELPDDVRDLYKNFQAAGMFKTESNPKGRLVYEDWVRKAGLVKD
jgi:hypothetical protein